MTMTIQEQTQANGNSAVFAAIEVMKRDGFITAEKAKEFYDNYIVVLVRKSGLHDSLIRLFFGKKAEDDTSKFICVKVPNLEKELGDE